MLSLADNNPSQFQHNTLVAPPHRETHEYDLTATFALETGKMIRAYIC
jgi:hypothetical protein